MIRNYIFLILTPCILVCSCSKPEVTVEKIDIQTVSQTSIEEEALTDLPDLFAPPLHLLNDTLLCLLNPQDASSIRIFRTQSKEMDQYTLKRKDTSIVISPDSHLNTKLDYLNRANNVYYELVVNNGQMSIANFIRLQLGDFSPSEAYQTEDKRFVCLGPFIKGLLSVYNSDKRSKEMLFFGNYPVIGPEYQYKEYLDFFQGHLARYDNQFVYASTYFGYLSSYIYKNKRLVKQWEKQTSDFLFHKTPDRIRFDSLHHEGFGCVTMGKEHIYAFSQYLSEKHQKENGILIFNRDGKLVSHLIIKNPMVFLTVDSQEKNLYAVSYNLKEEKLYIGKYNLPESPK